MKKEKDKSEDEVEQLLQAAQDQILLNLSLNSHIAHRAPPSPPPSSKKGPNHNDDDINLDLERRFQVLKTKPPATSTQHHNDQELRSVLGDDLSARFAALKAKSSSTTNIALGPTATAASKVLYEEESEGEEEQVQKLIEWAKDAARLDPSPPSDEDDDDDDNQDSSASDQDNHTPRKRK